MNQPKLLIVEGAEELVYFEQFLLREARLLD
jgi:hypothetical protein